MEHIGWIGTFFGLLSFSLLSFGKVKKEDLFFLICTAIAAFSFLIGSYLIANYQAVVSNIFFFTSSILAIFGIILKIDKIKEITLYILCIIGFIASSFYYIVFTKDVWIFQSLGWIPVISLPMIFLLYTQNKISESKYYLLNMITNVIFSIHLAYFHNYPLVILQIVSFLLALWGFKRLSNKNQKLINNI